MNPASSLIRAALFVADLDRASRFYAALGLSEVYFEGGLDGPSMAKTLGVPASTVSRCRIVKPPGGPNFGMVGLFELDSPSLAPLPAASGVAPRAGEAALVFYVRDAAATREALIAAGAGTAGPLIAFTMPHRQQNECCLRDPDGVLINLVERPPEEALQTASALTIAAGLRD